MRIRGIQPYMPKKGRSPSGIFSTNGKQKMDSGGQYANLTAKNQNATKKSVSSGGKSGGCGHMIASKQQPARKTAR